MCAFILPEGFIVSEKSLSNIGKCFILGNGPTLNKFILEKLNSCFVIGVNNVLFGNFEPTIICISDPQRLSVEHISLLNNSKSKLVLADHVAKIATTDLKLNESKIIKTFNLKFSPLFNTNFLSLYGAELESTRCIGSVVGDIAIPLAVFLGFKEIYILGLDEYWNINNLRDHHYYNSNVEKDAFEWASQVRRRNARYAKIDILSALKGSKIFNMSPGSAILSFEKKDMQDIYPEMVDQKNINIIDKYILFQNDMYKITTPNNCIMGCCSIKNIKTGEYLRHYNGTIIRNSELNRITFNDDSSFFCETSFTSKNKVSFRSYNMKKLYIAKDPYYERYDIKKFDSDFIAQDSSFEVFECN